MLSVVSVSVPRTTHIGWKAPGSGVLGRGRRSPCSGCLASSGGQGSTDRPQYSDSWQVKRISGELAEGLGRGKSREAVFPTVSLLKSPRSFLPYLTTVYLPRKSLLIKNYIYFRGEL